MELELEKRKKERYECVFAGGETHEENCEIIVPDNSPDIARIIKGSANAFLKDKNARDGKTDISGNIKGCVLYVAEGEKNIRRLNLSIPFAYVLDGNGITPESRLMAKVNVRAVDVREINPRKVSVRVGMDIHIAAYEYGELEVCGGVSKSDELGICVKRESVSLYQPRHIRQKSFSISDDIELTSSESEMNEILTSGVNLTVTDTKVIGNKSIIKGNAGINYVYTAGDDRLETGEYELPFSQIIDVEGMNTDNILEINLAVSGFELEPQYDASGKARYITIDITADATMFVFSQDEIELIDDVYSTKYNLSAKRENKKCTKLCEKLEKRIALTETVETGANVKRVLDVDVNMAPPVRHREEGGEVLASDATITAMYLADDDAVYSATRRVAAVCPLALEGGKNYDAIVCVKSKSFSVGAGNEINVRFFTDFDITKTEEISVPVISEISADYENPIETKGRAGVIVKRLAKDCDIWSLAKEYRSTEEEIRLANGIADDTKLSSGRMVLIPRKR